MDGMKGSLFLIENKDVRKDLHPKSLMKNFWGALFMNYTYE